LHDNSQVCWLQWNQETNVPNHFTKKVKYFSRHISSDYIQISTIQTKLIKSFEKLQNTKQLFSMRNQITVQVKKDIV
jgi:hypothetical protein